MQMLTFEPTQREYYVSLKNHIWLQKNFPEDNKINNHFLSNVRNWLSKSPGDTSIRKFKDKFEFGAIPFLVKEQDFYSEYDIDFLDDDEDDENQPTESENSESVYEEASQKYSWKKKRREGVLNKKPKSSQHSKNTFFHQFYTENFSKKFQCKDQHLLLYWQPGLLYLL